jgi:DNA-binding NarL/FixJ family response regulator
MSTALILLVEDHAGFANALLQMLSQNPNLEIVSVAESGEAALEYLHQSKVDLVLIDYSLPDMSGINLLQILQQDYPDLPCAILSGHLSTQYARRALEAGARGYLIKDNPLGVLSGLPRILKGEIYVSEELRNLGPNDLLTDLT